MIGLSQIKRRLMQRSRTARGDFSFSIESLWRRVINSSIGGPPLRVEKNDES